MNRRQMIVGGSVVIGASLVQTACPFDGVTRDKAVRYTGIAKDYLKDAAPLFAALGNTEIAKLVLEKGVPALEKLEGFLENSNIPQAGNTLDTIQDVLDQVATALLNLPNNSKRDALLATIGLVNLSLRTVALFVNMETPQAVMAQAPAKAVTIMKRAASPAAIKAAFDAARLQ